ncbi:hypothetical protein IU469_32000 [Nocardia puris]|uniref:Uncharacterized protein n=1 Tax=Nocardia puris TaxID=208602 RepID=A0A366D543_9NOCA|nr:GIY-YIG nuclease family protein [Nocardia puris]MBF6370296.1 hypothetical protein [Nocardia puris]RBO85163.1 hypothetical protein DFR74_11511 [Nocardia puris]
MGYTYVSQYDTGSLFKIGKATTLSQRQSSLRTGSSGKLELFDYVETDHPLEGERFLKRLWVARLRQHRKEVYRLTEDEVRAGMDELRRYLDEVLPAELAQQAELAELETVDNDDTVIEASEDVVAAHRRLVAIEADLRRLNAEAEPLRRAIMLAIGKNRGIAGIATFDKADSVRWFNAARAQAEHPELWEPFQKTTYDNAAFKKKYADLADSFMEPPKKRTFVLNEDLGS